MVEIRGVTKSFFDGARRVEVLRGIDLTIEAGERVAIVGASGAGKTTFMHIVGGLDHPTSGDVLYQGKDIFSLTGPALDAFRNRTIGFVFQFHQLLPEFSALENVMMPALIASQGLKKAAPLAEGLLREVGLGHRLTHKPGQLSGGSSNGWRSPGPSSCLPSCCSPMNPPGTWTAGPPTKSIGCCRKFTSPAA